MMLALQDAAMACLWSVITMWIVSQSIRLTKRLFPFQSLASQILVTTVLSVATVNFSLLSVGAVGFFAWFPALVAGIAACVVLWHIGNSVNQNSTVSIAIPHMKYANRNAVCPEQGPKGFAVNSTIVTTAMWLIAITAYVGYVVVNGLLSFPQDWDTLMYHLPFIDFWIQSGTLTSTQSARWSTPATGELIGSWFAIPFSGDFLVTLTNVPTFVLLASGTIEVSRRMGMSGLWPQLAAIGCLATHVSFRQSIDMSNDIAVAAFFMAGFAFALRYHQDGRMADACLVGICLGLLCGVKYFALGYAGVLGIMCLFLLAARWFAGKKQYWSHLSSNQGFKHERILGVHCLIAVSTAVFSGGYWYVRNWWMTGYALYPLGAPAMRDRILYEDLSRTTLIGNGDPQIPDLLIDAIWEMAGPLQLLALAASPAIVVLFLVVFIARWIQHRRDYSILEVDAVKFRRMVVALGVIGCGYVWLITPMLVEDQPGTLNHLRWDYAPVRYGLTFLSLAVVCLFSMIDLLCSRLFVRLRPWLYLVIGGLILAQITLLAARVVRPEIVASALLGANIALTALLLWHLLDRFPQLVPIQIPVALLCISVGVYFLSARWHNEFADHFNRYDRTTAYSALQNETHQIIVLSDRVYPFIGSRRQNFVTQPMLFYGIDAVADLATEMNADMVATRVDNYKILARYRPCWDALDADPRFDTYETRSAKLKLFRFKDFESTQ